jgi:hypothetical protein
MHNSLTAQSYINYVILFRFLKKGSQCRTTGSTELNSSSHAIFSVILKQQQITNDDDIFTTSDADLNADNNSAENNILNLEYLPIDTQLVSKFHFVDLAGSERVSSLVSSKNLKNDCTKKKL